MIIVFFSYINDCNCLFIYSHTRMLFKLVFLRDGWLVWLMLSYWSYHKHASERLLNLKGFKRYHKVLWFKVTCIEQSISAGQRTWLSLLIILIPITHTVIGINRWLSNDLICLACIWYYVPCVVSFWHREPCVYTGCLICDMHISCNLIWKHNSFTKSASVTVRENTVSKSNCCL